MKVILIQDVTNLGEEGDVVAVKDGYARNFLLPRKMVLPFTKQNQAVIESRRALIEKRKNEKRQEAMGLKERLEAVTLVFHMAAGDNGKLFGALTNSGIADELLKQGFQVDRKKIEVPEHAIKVQGNYKVRVRLYDNQEAILQVSINPKEEPAKAAGA